MDAEDLDHVKTHMALTAPVITHAGIAPTYEILERFAKELPNERLSSLLVSLSSPLFEFRVGAISKLRTQAILLISSY